MPMDRDTRTYLLLIGLPAILITAAGLLLLLFGGRGLASEMRRSGYDEQFGRYERNMRQRLATRARAYVKDGGADHVWAKDASASNTNFSDRVKYGWFAGTNGAVIGWTRLGDGTVIGYDEKPFRYEDSPELYLLGIGFVMVLLLFFTLFAGGWRLAWTARRVREDLEVKNSFLRSWSTTGMPWALHSSCTWACRVTTPAASLWELADADTPEVLEQLEAQLQDQSS